MLLALPALAESRYSLKKGFELLYEVEGDSIVIKGFPEEQKGKYKGKLEIPETIENLPVATICEDASERNPK